MLVCQLLERLLRSAVTALGIMPAAPACCNARSVHSHLRCCACILTPFVTHWLCVQVHPVHAHLIEWHMVAIEGKPVADSWPEFWQVPKDVVQIGAGVGTIDLVARYGPSLGRYMVRHPCHRYKCLTTLQTAAYVLWQAAPLQQ
jgi:hypothetical protein